MSRRRRAAGAATQRFGMNVTETHPTVVGERAPELSEAHESKSVFQNEAHSERRSKARIRARRLSIAVALAGCLTLIVPRVALAHGPLNPVASDYIATLAHVPAPLQAHVVDGDLRMWLRAPPRLTVIVLGYNGVPYLRFSRRGVQANTNSSMYYLNLTPPVNPPPSFTRGKPVRWRLISGGHQYEWHDGRLGALATVAVAASTRYVGRWQIPLEVDGRLVSMSGPVLHRPAPSILWFWPIVVVLACFLAGLRVRSPELDRRVARALGIVALLAFVTVAVGRSLHGRPTVTVFQWIELMISLSFAAWALLRLLRGRAGNLLLLVVAFFALYAGILTIPTLTHGYVLLAVPPFLGRTAAALCLGTVPALALSVMRLFDAPAAPGV